MTISLNDINSTIADTAQAWGQNDDITAVNARRSDSTERSEKQ